MTQPTDTLTLTLEDIAELWNCPKRHARDLLVKRPDFPEPVQGSTAKHRVWSAVAVHRYLASGPHSEYSLPRHPPEAPQIPETPSGEFLSKKELGDLTGAAHSSRRQVVATAQCLSSGKRHPAVHSWSSSPRYHTSSCLERAICDQSRF